MLKKYNLEIGQRFGKLEVLETYNNRWGLCQCDCGNQSVVRKDHLIRDEKATISCGCYRFSGVFNKRHGLTHTPTHNVWKGIRQRCNNPSNAAYSYYGGRGIRVCERWNIFENFLADMGVKPEGMTLDRLNNNGDYAPENCKWVDRTAQANNRRSNRMLIHNGEPITLAELSRKHAILPTTLDLRLKKGMSVEDAIRIPIRSLSRRRTSQV